MFTSQMIKPSFRGVTQSQSVLFFIAVFLLHNKLPQSWQIKTTQLYYLIVLMGQGSRCELAGSPAQFSAS